MPKGTLVAALVDMKYMREQFGRVTGTIVNRSRTRVWVQWHETGEVIEYDDGDARYWVDTGRWRLTQPKTRSIFSAM